jgi:hypothetical protein
MRASRHDCSPTPYEFNKLVGVDAATRICMFKNTDAVARVLVQFGEQQGHYLDAWPIEPGETFVLDPAAPKDQIWLASDTASAKLNVLMG